MTTTLDTRNLSLAQITELAETLKATFLHILYTPKSTKLERSEAKKEYKTILNRARSRNRRLKIRMDGMTYEQQDAILSLVQRINGLY